ncbi:tektin-1-like [Neocloeon triangulifer]|uniref:tektin-1-like n=1 Tax=Neocloeon triangulifer TaxID=2078957 RepID=UPI00286F0F52|nr:tektin-1-like [Neocloeon triangulifer]
MLAPAQVSESMRSWRDHNQKRCDSATASQRRAEVAVDAAQRVGDSCVDRAVSAERVTCFDLQERVKEVQFEHLELDWCKEKLEEEVRALDEVVERVLVAKEKCQEPLSVTKECMKIREGREGVEKVPDPVGRSLQLEENKISTAQNNLRKLQKDLIEQQRLLRIAVYMINKDASGKEAALSIDRRCVQLSVNSSDLQSALVVTGKKSSTELQWEYYTRSNVLQANAQIRKSRALRSSAEIVLRAACEDICKVYERTNLAFEKRISETKVAKEKLENELAETIQQANEVKRMLVQLQQPMAINQDHIKLVITRLNERDLRPGIEKCSDRAERQLNKELAQLQKDCESLEKQRQQSEASLHALQRTCQLVTQELELKALSMALDEVQCMTQRVSLNIHTLFVQPQRQLQ